MRPILEIVNGAFLLGARDCVLLRLSHNANRDFIFAFGAGAQHDGFEMPAKSLMDYEITKRRNSV